MTVLYIIEIVIGIGLLIFVHELGHFLMAKLHKVRVEAFSLGFPPNLFKKQWGETEYRIGLIPLGGYVKMAGESVGEGTGKPDELTSKSAWARVQIFAAGAIINLLVAFPIGILACWAGRFVYEPTVSAPGLPEVVAGMRPGDRIVDISGKPIDSLQQYTMAIVGSATGTAVPVRVRRVDGTEETLQVVPGPAETHQVVPLLTTIREVKENSEAWKQGLRTGDQVTKVNGTPIVSLRTLNAALRATVKPVPWSEYGYPSLVMVTVQRPSEAFKEYTVHLLPTLTSEWYYPEDYNLLEPVVLDGSKGTGVFGIIKGGDVIRRIDDVEVRSWQELKDAIEPRGGKKVRLVYERGGERKEADVQLGYNADTGKGQLGVPFQQTKRVALIKPGSPFEGVFETGDVLVMLNGGTGDISTLQLFMPKDAKDPKILEKPGPDSFIEVRTERMAAPIRLRPKSRVVGDVAALGLPDHNELPAPNEFFRRWGWGEGVRDGLREPLDLIKLTYQLLYKLVTLQESTKGLSGPVGIFQASYKSAQKGSGNFFWILCLITVNLGIFNLLPVPILDGGHVLLLLIEKLRGRPNSVTFVNYFQMTGLVLLLALVLFVTYGDIMRAI